ncbi:MAG: beta strand repeat-containing protein [Gaiellaceae bacterium]
MIAALLALLLAGSARAVHDLQFQLDGEVSATAYSVPSAATQVFDWGQNTAGGSVAGNDTAHSLFTVTTGATTQTVANNPTTVGLGKPFAAASFNRDFRSGASCTSDSALSSASATVCTNDSSTYATGSKDTLGIGNGGWQCNTDNNVNSKIDIANAYTASYFTGANGTGDHIIYFGLEKNKNNGTNDVGFWLLQGSASCSSAGATNFTGQHQNKDVLIVSEFTQGGGVSTIKAFQWAAAASGQFAGDGGCIDSNGNPNPGTGGCNNLPIGSGADCKTTSSVGAHPVDSLCATTNANCTTAGLPCSKPWNQTLFTPWLTWDATLGVGNRVVSPDFFEGAIDVTKVFSQGTGGAAPSCFNTVVPDTRSSASPTATLFDFVANQLGECHTDTTTTPVDAANHANPPASSIPAAPADADVTVQDKATVAVSGIGSFTGSIAWHICGRTDPSSTQLCDGTTGNVGVDLGSTAANANGDYFSPVVHITAAGRYCFRAEFSSTTVGVPPGSDSTSGECFTIAPRTPTLSTNATTAVAVGGALDDTAHLGNTAKKPGTGGPAGASPAGSINPATLGGNATGTITFTLYSAVTGNHCGTAIATRTLNVNGNGDYKASDGTGAGSLSPGVGVYYWIASYSGDLPNTTAKSGACDDANEVSRVVDARISITGTATNPVGQSHTFTVTVEVNDGTGWANAPAGTKPAVTVSPVPGTKTDNCDSTGTVNGQCTVVINSSSAGVFTANAAITISVSGVSLTRDTNPATADPCGGGNASCGPAVKTYVDASIALSPLTATNEVNQHHVVTATVTKNPGTGVVAAGSVPVVFTVTGNTANLTYFDSNADGDNNPLTATTNASGLATLEFTKSGAGSVTINASTTFAVGGVTLTRDTDPATPAVAGPNGSGPATKTFVDASISIAASATNEVGHAHTFTITVTAFPAGATPVTINAPTVTFSPVPTTVGPVTFVSLVGNVATYTVTINSPTAGKFTANASDTVTMGSVTVTRDTDPATATIGSGPGGSGPATKTFVDAYIVITPHEATNSVGDPHTFVVQVFQNDGLTAAQGGDGVTGFTSAPDHTFVTVSFTNQNGANWQTTLDTCASPNGTSGGSCSVTGSSASAGDVIAHATVTFSVGGVSLTRATDGTGNNSLDAIKHFISGSVSWVKHDNGGQLLGGATFSLCRINDYDIIAGMISLTPLNPPVCVNPPTGVADNGPYDADPAAGKFTVANLPLGRYKAQETVAPQGFELDPNFQTVDLTPQSPNGNATFANAFVDSRPVLKITGFGYTNAPEGNPQPGGIFKGATTYTINLHNYGTATAHLTNSNLTVSNNANMTCTPGNVLNLSGTDIAPGGDSGPISMTCHYDHPNPQQIDATLVVKYTTNGLERTASGSPATISYTVNPN